MTKQFRQWLSDRQQRRAANRRKAYQAAADQAISIVEHGTLYIAVGGNPVVEITPQTQAKDLAAMLRHAKEAYADALERNNVYIR